MKSKIAALALAATLLVGQTGMALAADDVIAYPDDPETSVGEAAWTVLSLPINLTTAVADGALGGIGGGFKGIVRTEEKFADATFGRADENPLLVPVGLVGLAVAVPVGFLVGLPYGIVKGAKYGWNMLDRLDDE